MKCRNCSTEAYDLIVDGLCLVCSAAIHSESFSPTMYAMLERMNNNLLNRMNKCVQVQFFTGKLQDISRQMNKFFKEEKIGKDRLIEIKVTKGAVMVVYE